LLRCRLFEGRGGAIAAVPERPTRISVARYLDLVFASVQIAVAELVPRLR